MAYTVHKERNSEVNTALCTLYFQALSGSKIEGLTKAFPGNEKEQGGSLNEKHKQPPTQRQTHNQH